jgi:hypothetical protein
MTSHTIAPEERLFAELDGQSIHSGTSHWLACVLGVHTTHEDAWVQLSLVGQFPCSLIVHLAPRTTAQQAIRAINSWLQCPFDDRPRIVDVC